MVQKIPQNDVFEKSIEKGFRNIRLYYFSGLNLCERKNLQMPYGAVPPLNQRKYGGLGAHKFKTHFSIQAEALSQNDYKAFIHS
jgi:hypothetical protein